MNGKCKGEGAQIGNPFDTVPDGFSAGSQATCYRDKRETRCRGKFYNTSVDAESDANISIL